MSHFVRNALLLFSATASVAGAQTAASTGSLRLSVKDPAGRALPARGILYGPTAGHSRTVEAASDGSLDLNDLAFGRYTLVLARGGFAQSSTVFVVGNQTPIERTITLNVGGINTTVSVIASTPIGALDVPLSDVPSPIQTLSAKTLEDTNAIDLTEAMKRRLNGVYVNENQNNPFQPDVNYRGYTASPLVGSPAEIVDKLGAFGEAGVQRVYLQMLDLADLDHLELFADGVVTQLR